MTFLESFLAFLGGLGLFLTAIKLLALPPLQLGGSRLRLIIARSAETRWRAALVGTSVGAVLQSTNGITFILVGLVTAGVFGTAGAMELLAWANVGTSLLVFVASFKLRILAVALLGTTGIILYYTRPSARMRRQVLEAMLYVGILLLGIDIIREGASALRTAPTVVMLVKLSQGSVAAALMSGFVFALLTQSSSTATIITVTAVQTGLLLEPDGVMILLGASLGSGASVVLMGANARGGQRQLVLFQGFLKTAGVAVLLPPFLLERLWGFAGLETFLQSFVPNPGLFLATIYLLCQVASLLVFACVQPWLPKLLMTLAPPALEESLAQPRFLHADALQDPGTALLLVIREQRRLAGLLVSHLDVDKEPGETATIDVLRVGQVSTSLSNAITEFLTQLVGTGLSRSQLRHLALLRSRNDALRALHETAAEFVMLQHMQCLDDVAQPIFTTLSEGLAALFRCVEAATGSRNEGDVIILAKLTADRSTLVDEMRMRLLRADGADPEARRTTYLLTSLFERMVWLVQRYVDQLKASDDVYRSDTRRRFRQVSRRRKDMGTVHYLDVRSLDPS